MIDTNKIYICHSSDVSSHSLYGIILSQTGISVCIKTFSNYGRTEYPERSLSLNSFEKYYSEATKEDVLMVKEGTKLSSYCNQFYQGNDLTSEDIELDF